MRAAPRVLAARIGAPLLLFTMRGAVHKPPMRCQRTDETSRAPDDALARLARGFRIWLFIDGSRHGNRQGFARDGLPIAPPPSGTLPDSPP